MASALQVPKDMSKSANYLSYYLFFGGHGELLVLCSLRRKKGSGAGRDFVQAPGEREGRAGVLLPSALTHDLVQSSRLLPPGSCVWQQSLQDHCSDICAAYFWMNQGLLLTVPAGEATRESHRNHDGMCYSVIPLSLPSSHRCLAKSWSGLLFKNSNWADKYQLLRIIVCLEQNSLKSLRKLLQWEPYTQILLAAVVQRESSRNALEKGLGLLLFSGCMRQTSDRAATSEGFSSETERIKRRKNIKKWLALCGLVSFKAEWCSSGCEGKG